MPILRKGGVVLLLLLYVAGVLQVESIHNVFHHHEQAELHTLEQENDRCHRTIYHGEKEKDCGHKTHVKKSDKCSLCAVVSSGSYLHMENLVDKIFIDTTDRFSIDVLFIARLSGHQKPSRAPPIA